MKLFSKSLWSVLAVGSGLFLSVAAFGLRPSEKLDAAQTKAAVAELTAKLLENSQFAHHPLDEEFAGKLLDHYCDALDSAHMIFLQSDMEEFARLRPHLAQDLLQAGDTTPAQTIFQRYLERLDQRATYVASLLKTGPFDFTADEHYHYDRKNAVRPQDLTAGQQLWKQQLRFEYLQEKLAGKKDADIAQTLSRRSSRVLQTMRKFNDQSVLELYLEALAHVYDPHSDYMGREELQSFNIGMNLSLVGIGATLQAEDGFCRVRELVPGGPAARSGLLKNGDRIVGVAQGEGKEFTDLVDMPLTQAVDLIRGAKGSAVTLSLIPAGAADTAVRQTITIIRDEIKLEDQQAKARVVDLPVEDGKTRRVGIIDLPGFYAGNGEGLGKRASATADVAALVRKLQQAKVTGLILDLRRNGGGSLEEAINMTGLFIPAGPVVQTRTLDGRVEVGASHDSMPLYDGPLVVLTSRLSASASEILAGALQDYGRAVIVGDTSTFGKGTVQSMVPLDRVMEQEGFTPSDDPGALKVTISKFYRPSGQSTQLAGVKSDIVLPSLTDTPEIGEAELDNPLPWDTIKPADFEGMNRVSLSLAELKAHSTGRISQDSDFVDLRKDCEQLRKDREGKSISLNEAERVRENAENKARLETRKREHEARTSTSPLTYEITLKNIGQPGLGEPVKNPKPFAKADSNALLPSTDDDAASTAPTDDIILRETEHIVSDYADILSHQKSTVVTAR